MAKFLSQYEPQSEDFVGSRIELQSGGTAQVNPHPGYHIMVHLNTESELLRLVSWSVYCGIQLCSMLLIYMTASVVLATDPEARVRFPALPEKKSSGSGTGSTQPRENN
jgi:hypothetical protein